MKIKKDGAKMVPKREKKQVNVGDYVKFYEAELGEWITGLVEKRSGDGYLWIWVSEGLRQDRVYCLPESVCEGVNPPALIGG